MSRMFSAKVSWRGVRLQGSLALILGSSLCLAAEKPAEPAPKPQIEIFFDDDASNLIISAQWSEDGQLRKESLALGKNISISFTQRGKKWVQDRDFKSKNWEAYLYPDFSGFVLMEREYNGKRFENLSLNLYQYHPRRRMLILRPANGSPWWSMDGTQFAVIESAENNTPSSAVIYDAQSGKVIQSYSQLSQASLQQLFQHFVKARVCDDNQPCAPPLATRKKRLKFFK